MLYFNHSKGNRPQPSPQGKGEEVLDMQTKNMFLLLRSLIRRIKAL